MKTKKRILTTATTLFNEATVGDVSTNHIAEAAGISPGNLYYHYHNKEEIIRAILERMFEAFGEVWVLPNDRKLTVQNLRQTLETAFSIHWRYRFFYREQVSLMRRDPELAARHQEIQQQRTNEQVQVLERFVKDGVLIMPEDDTHFRALITASWIITNNWLTFVELSGEAVEPKQLERGSDLILRVIAPYLSETARTYLNFGGTTHDKDENQSARHQEA